MLLQILQLQELQMQSNDGGGSGNYTVDEKITQSTTGAQGRVVEWDSTNKILYYVQEKYANYGLDTAGNLTAFSGTNAIAGAIFCITYTSKYIWNY